MSYEFQSTLYPTKSALVSAIAYQWLTAGGINSHEEIAEIIQGASPESITDECIKGWGLDEPSMQNEDQDWMQYRDITRNDIVKAVREFIAKFA